jgi:rhomboid protease GluP
VVSNWVGHPFTIGASGAVFGLLGAIVAFGKKRGGTFGAMVLRQYGYMALLMFILSFFMRAVNNAAHAGGFVGGLVAGLLIALAEHRRETSLDWVLALACIAVTLAGFALSLAAAFSG